MTTAPAHPDDPADLAPPTPQGLVLSGRWTVAGLGAIGPRLAAAELPAGSAAVADASRITGLDSAGAWLLHTLLQRLDQAGHPAQLQGLPERFNVRAKPRVPASAETAHDPGTGVLLCGARRGSAAWPTSALVRTRLRLARGTLVAELRAHRCCAH